MWHTSSQQSHFPLGTILSLFCPPPAQTYLHHHAAFKMPSCHHLLAPAIPLPMLVTAETGHSMAGPAQVFVLAQPAQVGIDVPYGMFVILWSWAGTGAPAQEGVRIVLSFWYKSCLSAQWSWLYINHIRQWKGEWYHICPDSPHSATTAKASMS